MPCYCTEQLSKLKLYCIQGVAARNGSTERWAQICFVLKSLIFPTSSLSSTQNFFQEQQGEGRKKAWKCIQESILDFPMSSSVDPKAPETSSQGHSGSALTLAEGIYAVTDSIKCCHCSF